MDRDIFNQIIHFIRAQFPSGGRIPLHEPKFVGNERKYVMDAIDSTFVSSVGKYVDHFESKIKEITGAKFAVATVNGTAALHVAVSLAGVKPGDEVLTQPLTFIATANAIVYTGASPIFIDVDMDTLGMSPKKLSEFLMEFTEVRESGCYNRRTGKRIAGCVPMHTFGFPLRIDEIITICKKYNIPVIEDAAESLGSYYRGRHTGTLGLLGTFSFNGNKTVTSGGGGAIITDDPVLGALAKHLTTTAKLPHKWEYVHNAIGYNYRMPNLNAALAVAQLECLPYFIQNKRDLAHLYQAFFDTIGIPFVTEIDGALANYWLMTILLNDKNERNTFLADADQENIMVRPAWKLINKLDMYRESQCGDLSNAFWLEDRIVNIPSSVRINNG